MTKWPNERLVKTRVVSGFIFLRLLCPAILNPRQFNLLSGKNLKTDKNLIIESSNYNRYQANYV